MTIATLPPSTDLATQLAELRRERKMRDHAYPHFIETRKLTERQAMAQNAGLDGAIVTLERLVRAKTAGEPGRQELIDALREAVQAIEEGSECPGKVRDVLARVPT